MSIAIVLEILGYVSVSIVLSFLDSSFGLEINIYNASRCGFNGKKQG
ncbi:hypothetical protein WIW90_06440 [Sulfolobaceae archaeon RB850M]